MDAAYYEHAFVSFHFAGYIRHELPVARINLTRLQRASEGAHHSTRGSGNDVINRCSMGFLQFGGIDLVMFGDRTMNAENYGLRLAR
jgi:hypothetical protein